MMTTAVATTMRSASMPFAVFVVVMIAFYVGVKVQIAVD